MFLPIGIFLVVAFFYAKSKKKAAPTTTPAPKVASPVAVKAPVTKAPTTKVSTPTAKPTTKAPAVSPVQGLPWPGTPDATTVFADIFGSLGGTNPKVLNTSLPYGGYNPTGNTTTPPIVVAPGYSR